MASAKLEHACIQASIINCVSGGKNLLLFQGMKFNYSNTLQQHEVVGRGWRRGV